jgi:hypothetical protein
MPSDMPSDMPSANPTPTPVVTIVFDSLIQWNYECLPNMTSEEIIDLAQVIEKSMYDAANTTGQTVIYYVSEICNVTVGDHIGYPVPARRLQGVTDFLLSTQISAEGTEDDAQAIYNAANSSLTTVVSSGELTNSINTNSNGTVNVTVDSVESSNFTVITNPPTKAPTKV